MFIHSTRCRRYLSFPADLDPWAIQSCTKNATKSWVSIPIGTRYGCVNLKVFFFFKDVVVNLLLLLLLFEAFPFFCLVFFCCVFFGGNVFFGTCWKLTEMLNMVTNHLGSRMVLKLIGSNQLAVSRWWSIIKLTPKPQGGHWSKGMEVSWCRRHAQAS